MKMNSAKIVKIITCLTLVVILVGMLGIMSGCDKEIQEVFSWYDGENIPTQAVLVMNAGEEFLVEESQFDVIDVKFERFVLEVRDETHKNVVLVDGNRIIATNSGYAIVIAIFYDRARQGVIRSWGVVVAQIYVINKEQMTPITTAEELADINDNLDGHFILMADIDLAGREWVPIGRRISAQERIENPGLCACREPETFNPTIGTCLTFRGFFVNPYGFSINNLTITTSQTATDIGLFGAVYRYSLISGIVLDRVNIDVSDYEGAVHASPRVGGIAGTTMPHAMIVDCFVRGEIVGGGEFTGGIVGVNSEAFIFNSDFRGSIRIIREVKSSAFAIGGIVGFNGFSQSRRLANIVNCSVKADLDGGEWASVGGIVGIVSGTLMPIKNTLFLGGNLKGLQTGTMIGRPMGGGEPISFEYK